jgi:hypothetical protein
VFEIGLSVEIGIGEAVYLSGLIKMTQMTQFVLDQCLNLKN